MIQSAIRASNEGYPKVAEDFIITVKLLLVGTFNHLRDCNRLKLFLVNAIVDNIFLISNFSGRNTSLSSAT